MKWSHNDDIDFKKFPPFIYCTPLQMMKWTRCCNKIDAICIPKKAWLTPKEPLPPEINSWNLSKDGLTQRPSYMEVLCPPMVLTKQLGDLRVCQWVTADFFHNSLPPLRACQWITIYWVEDYRWQRNMVHNITNHGDNCSPLTILRTQDTLVNIHHTFISPQ